MSVLRQFLAGLFTPQAQPLRNRPQVRNHAGGYVFAIDDWARLDRFLVLGSEQGTYYSAPQTLTAENAAAVLRCLQSDGPRTVARIAAISDAGRAPRNDPALFALALCAAQGDEATRRAALEALPQVARTGTHLFHFLDFVHAQRGWGRGLRRAVADWYNRMSAEQLAYQAIKYRQRDGWTHRDALRLAHPRAATPQHQAVFHWITQGWSEIPGDPPGGPLNLIWALEKAQRAASAQETAELAATYRLPWEALPTEHLTSPEVWEALLPHLPLTALLRNLARLTAIGLLPRSRAALRQVLARLGEGEHLRKARIHPIQVLAALSTYQSGHGARGSLQWQPVGQIVDALDGAFYEAFQNVTPTGKRLQLALDVSGSMGYGEMAGVPGLTPRVAAAAMALITAATESDYTFTAFQHRLTPLTISPRMRLDDVLRAVDGLPFGATDCALPMLWALEQRLPFDAFVIYTDNETWYGQVHPVEALARYREAMDIPAKLIVVGMTATGFSIADPDDGGMLDVVGFDTAAPALTADFIAA